MLNLEQLRRVRRVLKSHEAETDYNYALATCLTCGYEATKGRTIQHNKTCCWLLALRDVEQEIKRLEEKSHAGD